MSFAVGSGGVISGLVGNLEEGCNVDHVFSTGVALFDVSGSEGIATTGTTQIITALCGIVHTIQRGEAFVGIAESYIYCHRGIGLQVEGLLTTGQEHEGQNRNREEV